MSPDRQHRGVPHTSPLDRILRRESPFDSPLAHAAKVAECVRLLKRGFDNHADLLDTVADSAKSAAGRLRGIIAQ